MGKKEITSWKDCLDARDVVSFASKQEKLEVGQGANHIYIKNKETNEKTFVSRHCDDLSTGVARNIYLFFLKAGLLVLLFVFFKWYFMI